VVGALLLLASGRALAAQIPAGQVVAGTVTTSFGQVGDGAGYTSVFNGTGLGASVTGAYRVTHLKAHVGTASFHMSVAAQQCCDIFHTFELGPWSGTWSVDSQGGDTLYGTAAGEIGTISVPQAVCLNPPFCGPLAAAIGPGVRFTLTITGGTGRYAGASGSGTLTGNQTPQAVDLGPIPPAAFEGQLSFSASSAAN
jgi:hypothetical protein